MEETRTGNLQPIHDAIPLPKRLRRLADSLDDGATKAADVFLAVRHEGREINLIGFNLPWWMICFGQVFLEMQAKEDRGCALES